MFLNKCIFFAAAASDFQDTDSIDVDMATTEEDNPGSADNSGSADAFSLSSDEGGKVSYAGRTDGDELINTLESQFSSQVAESTMELEQIVGKDKKRGHAEATKKPVATELGGLNIYEQLPSYFDALKSQAIPKKIRDGIMGYPDSKARQNAYHYFLLHFINLLKTVSVKNAVLNAKPQFQYTALHAALVNHYSDENPSMNRAQVCEGVDSLLLEYEFK
jgi:hypothetical protein